MHGQTTLNYKYISADTITNSTNVHNVFVTSIAADGARHHPHRKPYATTQHLMLLMMDVCTRNMSS